MDPAVAICHVLPELWDHAEKQFKNEKVTLYETASALECVQYFAAQGSILDIVVSLCVIIIQFIYRSNILIDVGILGGKVQLVINIFAIVLLWHQKKYRTVDIV